MAYTAVVENHLVGITRRLPLLIGYHVPLVLTPNPVLPSQSTAPEKYSSRSFSHQTLQISWPVSSSVVGSQSIYNEHGSHHPRPRQYSSHISHKKNSTSIDSFHGNDVERYRYRVDRKQFRHYEFKSHKVKPKTRMVQFRCISQKSNLPPGPIYNTKYRCEPKKVAKDAAPFKEELELQTERGLPQEKVEQRLRCHASILKKRQWEEKQRVIMEEKRRDLTSFSSSDLINSGRQKSFFKSKSDTFVSKPALNDLKARIVANKLANNIRKPYGEPHSVPDRPILIKEEPKIKLEGQKEENLVHLSDFKSNPQHPSPFLNTSSSSMPFAEQTSSDVNPRPQQFFGQSLGKTRYALDMTTTNTPQYNIRYPPLSVYKSDPSDYPSPVLVKKKYSSGVRSNKSLNKNNFNEDYFNFLKRVNNLKEDRMKQQRKKDLVETTLPIRTLIERSNISNFKSNFNQARKQSSFSRKDQNAVMKFLFEKKNALSNKRESSSLTDGPSSLNELNSDSFLSDLFKLFKSHRSTSLIKRALSSGPKKPWKNVGFNEECDDACAPNIIAKYLNTLEKGKRIHKQSVESPASNREDKNTTSDVTGGAQEQEDSMASFSESKLRKNITQVEPISKSKISKEIEARVKEKLKKSKAIESMKVDKILSKPEKLIKQEKHQRASERALKIEKKLADKIEGKRKRRVATVEPRPKLVEEQQKMTAVIPKVKVVEKPVAATGLPATDTPIAKPPSNPGGIWKSDRLEGVKASGSSDDSPSAENVYDEKLAKEMEGDSAGMHPDVKDYKQLKLEASAKSMEADLWGDTPSPEVEKKWTPPSIWANNPFEKSSQQKSDDSKYPTAPSPPVVLGKIKDKAAVKPHISREKSKELLEESSLKSPVPEKSKGSFKDDSSLNHGKKASNRNYNKSLSQSGLGKQPPMLPYLEMADYSGNGDHSSVNTVELLRVLQNDPLKKRLPPSMFPPAVEKKEKVVGDDISSIIGDSNVLFHRVYSNPTETRVVTLSVDSLHEIRTEVNNPEVPPVLISKKDSLDYFGGKTFVEPPVLRKLPKPKYVYSRETPVRKKLKIPKQISEPIPFKYDQMLKQTSSEPIDFGIPSPEKKIFPFLLETASEPVDVGYSLPKIYEYKTPWTSEFLSHQKDSIKKMFNSLLEHQKQKVKSEEKDIDVEPKLYKVPYTPGDTIPFLSPEVIPESTAKLKHNVADVSTFNSLKDRNSSPADSNYKKTADMLNSNLQKSSITKKFAFFPEFFTQSTQTHYHPPNQIQYQPVSQTQYPLKTELASPHLYSLPNKLKKTAESVKPIEHLLQSASLQEKNRTTKHLETPALNLAEVEGTQEEVTFKERRQTAMKLSGREAFFPKDVNYIASHIPSNAGDNGGNCDGFRRQLLEEACYCETVTITVKPNYPEPPPSEFYSRHNPCRNVETWVPSFRSVERGDSAAQVLLYKVKNNIYKFKCHTIDAWNCIKAGLNIIFGIFSRKNRLEMCDTYQEKLVNMQMSPDRPPCYWVCPPSCCPAPCKQSVFSRIKGQTGCKRCYTVMAPHSKSTKGEKFVKNLSKKPINWAKRSFSTTPNKFKYPSPIEYPLRRLQKIADQAYRNQAKLDISAPVVQNKLAAIRHKNVLKDNCSTSKRYCYLKSVSRLNSGIKDTKSAYPQALKPAGRSSLLCKTPMTVKPLTLASGCYGMASGTPGLRNHSVQAEMLRDVTGNWRRRPGADVNQLFPNLRVKSHHHTISEYPKLYLKNPYKSCTDYINNK